MTFNAELPTSSAKTKSMDENNLAVRKPNRRHFQSVLEAINRSIAEQDDERMALIGNRYFSRDGSSATQANNNNNNKSTQQQGELFRLKNEIVQMKSERDTIRSKSIPQLTSKIDELEKKLKLIKEEISKIEYEDLYYKDEQQLRHKIANLKDQYSNLNSGSLRVEQGIVKEIDRFERNLKRLEKYKKLKDEREDMLKKYHEMKADRHNFYKQNQLLKNNLNETFRKERECRNRDRALIRELNNLNQQRTDMMLKYEKEREEYVKWVQQNKIPQQQLQQRQGEISSTSTSTSVDQRKIVKRTPSWKPTKQQQINNFNDDSSDSETDDYEPYAKEKQICRNLVSYLQTFLSEPQQKLVATSSSDNSYDLEKRPSITEAHLPVTGFKKDEIEEEVQHYSSSSPKQILKRHTKKEKRRPTQAIPLEPHVIEDFAKVDVTAPVNYIEVPIALQKVKDRLQFYEDQMHPILSFSYSYEDFAAYPSSESEMTVDSARFSHTWSEADDSLSSPLMQSLSLSLSQSSTFDKQFSIKEQRSSSSFEIESPKDISSPVVDGKLLDRTKKLKLNRVEEITISDNNKNSSNNNRSSSSSSSSRRFSCDGKIVYWRENGEQTSSSDDFSIGVIRKFSSLICLSSSGAGKVNKMSKVSTYDEGIDVFLSKDSSANSNVVRGVGGNNKSSSLRSYLIGF